MSNMIISSIIKPQTPTKHEGRQEVLSSLDKQINIQIQFGLYFNKILDHSTLQKALPFLLDDYPTLSGRLVYEKNTLIVRDFNSGCLFVCDVDETRELKLDAYQNEESPTLKLLKLKNLCNGFGDNSILFKIKLTTFTKSNTSYVNVCFNHALGDANSYSNILQHYSYLCAGKFGCEIKPQPIGHRFRKGVLDSQTHDKNAIEKKIENLISSNSIFNSSFGSKQNIQEALGIISIVCYHYLFWKDDHVIDFLIQSNKVTQLKKKLLSGEWGSLNCDYITNFEITRAIFLLMNMLVYHGTSRSLTISETTKVIKCKTQIWGPVNSRNRQSNINSNYFGNALVLFTGDVIIDIPKQLLPTTNKSFKVNNTTKQLLFKTLLNITQQIHNIIEPRKNTEYMNTSARILNSYHQDLEKDVTQLNFEHRTGMHLNRWNANGFLEVDFGCGEKAQGLYLYPNYCYLFRSFCLEVPHGNGDYYHPSYSEQAITKKAFLKAFDLPIKGLMG